ncbi:MAG: ERCC4 domain-containing protein, partial [Anaerolineae bacterium]
MDERKIKIIADDRERNGGVISVLRADGRCDIKTQRIPVGDYLIDERVLVERKTLPDLLASIKDGRLFRQALRLVEAESWCVIVLEGTARDLPDSVMRREAVQGALITLALYLGIPLLRSTGPDETARLLIYIARQGRTFSGDGPNRHGRLPRGKRRLQIYILQGFPGIGPRRAARLLERFGTLDRILTAEIDVSAKDSAPLSPTWHDAYF